MSDEDADGILIHPGTIAHNRYLGLKPFFEPIQGFLSLAKGLLVAFAL